MLVPDWLRKKVTIANRPPTCTATLQQQVLHRFLTDTPSTLIWRRSRRSGRQRAAMEAALARRPPGVSYTRRRGMFLWLTLPPSVSAMALFDEASRRRWLVPGAPFYVRPEIQNTLRLSFCVDEATTEEGVKRLCPCPHALSLGT
jgi:2-aminoadipate transaminase